MRNFYVRYIGAGAVASAGIITLIKSIPTMVKSFKLGMSRLRDGAGGLAQIRTDRDLSLKAVGITVLSVIALITVLPFLFPTIEPWNFMLRMGIAVLVVIFAFFFVTVSARIVGLVGVTSNPTSGMIIATLICTSLIFALFGWTDTAGKVTIIVMGTMVGVAASIAGDASQDIKTGFLLGATPSKQQIGEIIGVLTTAFFVAGSVFLLADQYEIGGPELAAPQANMMKLVVDGIIDQSIPWSLVLVGVAITLVIHFLKLPTLAFAVGVYLPLATMAPVFVGGLIRRIVEKKSSADKGLLQKRRESGILFGSGLVGGEGLMGVGIAGYAFFAGRPTPLLPDWLGWLEHYPQHLLNALPFLLLVYLLWRAIHTDEGENA
jgi:putative OPT family oligopeptide transporter